jgi:hypothetical protein
MVKGILDLFASHLIARFPLRKKEKGLVGTGATLTVIPRKIAEAS